MPQFNRRRFIAGSSLAAASSVSAVEAKAKAKNNLRVQALKTEMTENLLGTQVRLPRFSWQISNKNTGVKQKTYHLRVGSAPNMSDLWDTGVIDGDQCFDIAYAGTPLKSMQQVWWSVDVTDTKGGSARSQQAKFEMGLLDPEDWKAKWIAAEDGLAEGDRTAGLQWIWSKTALDNRLHAFRLDFEAPSTLVSAQVMIAGKDWIREVWANGEKLPTPNQLVPNWGTLVEVPMSVRSGQNSLCVLVQAETTGFFPVDGGAFASLIRLHLQDGAIVRLVSDSKWRVQPLPPKDWTAPDFDTSNWVRAQKSGSDAQNDPRPPEPAMHLKKHFLAKSAIVKARLYATALGAYQATLNGRAVRDAILAPEISVAKSHIYYQTYDVTSLIREGNNAIGFTVGDGWYGSAFGWRLERYGFGPAPRRLLAQLRLDYADGSMQWIATDESWHIGNGPIVKSEIYDGEIYDARLKVDGWDLAGYDDSQWSKAKLAEAPKANIIAQTSPSIRPIMKRRATVTQPRPGVYVYDFGQNFAGWARLRAKGKAGHRVLLKFAEYLKPDGEVDQANLRMAKCRNEYILRGDKTGEVYEPHFTYFGFRYIQVENYPGTPTPSDIEGIVLSSACKETGRMDIKDPVIQKFWENALWSQRSNFFAVPTDCPQRDERMGWMGDIQVFIDAACFNMECAPFIRRFLHEARASQTPQGAYPIVCPQPESFPEVTTAGWSEAGIILPWTLWWRYGDTAVIDENWSSMRRWMDYLQSRNPDFIWRNERGLDLGDWLSVDAVKPDDETTPRILCATAYWAYCAQLMAQMAKATNRRDEVNYFTILRAQISKAFVREFVDANGKAGNGSQTSQILALHFNLVPVELKASAALKLATDIRRRGMKLSTGFLGTPYILDVLADAGLLDEVSGLLLQREKPSWGYMPMKGATTMWERWDGDTGDLAMNSYNHYAYGAVCGFMYRRLAGLSPIAPGFRKIHAEPLFFPGVGKVTAKYESCMGTFEAMVNGNANEITSYGLTLPANTEATVVLPLGNWREAGKDLNEVKAIKTLKYTDRSVVMTIGPGSYSFVR